MKDRIAFLIALSLFATISIAGVFYYGGGEAVNLENDIGFDRHGQKIKTGDSDNPTSVAKAGGTGSIYLSTSGDAYLKQDTGTTTNWNKIGELPIASTDVTINTIGSPTYNTLDELLTASLSSGWISGGEITDNGDGTIDIAAGKGLIRSSNSATATIYSFEWAAAANVSLTDNSENYVYVDYNAGSPQIAVVTSGSTIRANEKDKFELYEIFREGTILHITRHRQTSGDAVNLMQQRAYDIQRVTRSSADGGIIIGASGTRNVTVSAGSIWIKLEKTALGPVDTSTGDTFSAYYRSATPGEWTKVASQTQWNNTNYDDGDGTLANITNNWYVVNWFYIGADSGLVTVIPQAQYSSLAAAEAEAPPSTAPDVVTEHSLLIGRIIAKQGSNLSFGTESAFTNSFVGTMVSSHSDLSNLTADDHTQYVLANGTRAMDVLSVTGGATFSSSINVATNVNLNENLDVELVTNGSFTGSATGWTLGTGWAYGTNNVVKNVDGTGTLTQSIAVTSGQTYKLQFNLNPITVGNVYISVNSTTIGYVYTAAGFYTLYFEGDTTGSVELKFTPSSTSRFTIDDVTVKQVLGSNISNYGNFNLFGGRIIFKQNRTNAKGSIEFWNNPSGSTMYSLGNNFNNFAINYGPTSLIQFSASSSMAINIPATVASTLAVTKTDNSSSGTFTALTVNPTFTQTGTAGYNGVLVNSTETTTGSGTKNLLDLQLGGISKFSVSSLGVVLAGNYIQTYSPGSGVTISNTRIYRTAHSTALGLNDNTAFTNSGTGMVDIGGGPANIYTQSSGTNWGARILPTYNQTGTAANNDLLINRTETAIGSGFQYLINGQVGGVTRFSVAATGGVIYTAGGITIDGHSNLSAVATGTTENQYVATKGYVDTFSDSDKFGLLNAEPPGNATSSWYLTKLTNSTFAATTTNAINNQYSYLFTNVTSSGSEYLCTPSIATPLKTRGTNASVSFPYNYDGTDGDFRIWMEDVTNTASLDVPLSITAATKGTAGINFFVPTTAANVRLCAQVMVVNNGKKFLFDDVVFSGKTFFSEVANVTEWQSYTPTFVGVGTPTGVDFSWRRVGENVEINGYFTTGTVTASSFSVSIPSGIVGDTTKSNESTGIATVQGSNPIASQTFTSSSTTIGIATVDPTYGGLTGTQLGSSAFSSIKYSAKVVGWGATNDYVITPAKSGADTYYLGQAGNALTNRAAEIQYDCAGTIILQRNSSTITCSTTQTDDGLISINYDPKTNTAYATDPTRFYARYDNTRVSISIDGAIDTNLNAVAIFKNGVGVAYGSAVSSSGESSALTTSLHLNRGDYFSVGSTSSVTSSGDNFVTTISAQVQNASALAAIPVPTTCYVKETQNSGTNGGTFTAGSWVTRVLNTINTDNSVTSSSCPWASVSSNQVTIQPGKYMIRGRGPAVGVDTTRTILYSITDTATLAVGSSAYLLATSGVGGDSFVSYTLDNTSPKVIELRQRAGTTSTTAGLGVAASWGDKEVYSTLEILKLK